MFVYHLHYGDLGAGVPAGPSLSQAFAPRLADQFAETVARIHTEMEPSAPKLELDHAAHDVIAEAQEILAEAVRSAESDEHTPASITRSRLSPEALAIASLILMLACTAMLKHGAPKALQWLNDVTTMPVAYYALLIAIIIARKK